MANNSITLAITGASGIPYGVRLLECLLKADLEIHLMVSTAAQVVAATETPWKIPHQPEKIALFFSELFSTDPSLLKVYGKENWMAPIASGSNVSRAMVVCPCSSSSLASIANGISSTLIERAADVILKEKKQLILVTRETPLSVIHIENMLKLAKIGATIMPASPGFYYKATLVSELVDFMVARILDHLNVDQNLLPRWGASSHSSDDTQ